MSETESGYDPDPTDEYLPVEWVPRDAIEPNDWNPNELDEDEYEQLRDSIADNGWTMPIVVHAEEMYIIDGEHRWQVAEDELIAEDPDLTPVDVPAGYVPVYGITVSEEQAKLATVQHNRARGEVSVEGLQTYLEELQSRGVLSEVADRIGYDEDDANEILGEIEPASMPDETMPWEEEADPDVVDDGDDADTESDTEDEDAIPELHEDRVAALLGDPPEHLLEDARTVTVIANAEEFELIAEALGDEMRAQSLVNLVKYVQHNDALDDVRAYGES